jgi:hypothetical protein
VEAVGAVGMVSRAAIVLAVLAAIAAPGDPAKEGDEALRARRFAAAEGKYSEALAAEASAPARRRLEDRRADAALARAGLEALAREIGAHPDRFVRLEIGGGVVLSATSADAEGVSGSVQGGTSRIPWGSLDRKVLADLLERARLPAADGLGAAALLQLAGDEDGAERSVLGFQKGGGDVAVAAKVLARWRRESPPPGGYVEVDGRLVTPEDRDRYSVEDRKAAAYERLQSDNAAARRQGFEALRDMGEPARTTLVRGLRARRGAVAREIAGMKIFSAPSTRARLKVEVEKRRAEALAFIEDPKRYPYPSETHAGQPEVDRLVGLVRQAWEDPFAVAAPWDPAVEERLRLVAETDAWTAEIDPEHRPDPAAVHAPVNALLDVPGLFPDEHSVKVLEFNGKVRTTADREERDCVLAVNEYRIMMGNAVPGLRNPGERAARQGYKGGVGENIAMGRPTGRGAFDGWFHSSGHHRNMVAAGWTELGAGRCGEYFTQVFGRLGGKALVEPDPPLPPPGPDVAPDPDLPTAEPR